MSKKTITLALLTTAVLAAASLVAVAGDRPREGRSAARTQPPARPVEVGESSVPPVHIVQLKRVPARSVMETLQQLRKNRHADSALEQVALAVHEPSNSLIVIGPQELVQMIRSIADGVDKENPLPPEARTPRGMCPMCQKMRGGMGQGEGMEGGMGKGGMCPMCQKMRGGMGHGMGGGMGGMCPMCRQKRQGGGDEAPQGQPFRRPGMPSGQPEGAGAPEHRQPPKLQPPAAREIEGPHRPRPGSTDHLHSVEPEIQPDPPAAEEPATAPEPGDRDAAHRPAGE